MIAVSGTRYTIPMMRTMMLAMARREPCTMKLFRRFCRCCSPAVYFKYTKKKYGEGRRIFKMTPLHHHYQKEGIPALISRPAHAIPEAKIVTRFWLIGVILAVSTLALLKIR